MKGATDVGVMLANHAAWLDDAAKGPYRAAYADEDFSGGGLKGADLRMSVFISCRFDACDLTGADLSGSCLSGSSFDGASLGGARLTGCGLDGCSFRNACLTGADISDSDLGGAVFDGSVMDGALAYGVKDADFSGARNAPVSSVLTSRAPETGAFTCWKAARDGLLVELEVPADSERTNLGGGDSRCRCRKARVLRIENRDGTVSMLREARSLHDREFVYRLGETVEVPDYRDDDSMSGGIYFFTDREKAAAYCGR